MSGYLDDIKDYAFNQFSKQFTANLKSLDCQMNVDVPKDFDGDDDVDFVVDASDVYSLVCEHADAELVFDKEALDKLAKKTMTEEVFGKLLEFANEDAVKKAISDHAVGLYDTMFDLFKKEIEEDVVDRLETVGLDLYKTTK